MRVCYESPKTSSGLAANHGSVSDRFFNTVKIGKNRGDVFWLFTRSIGIPLTFRAIPSGDAIW